MSRQIVLKTTYQMDVTPLSASMRQAPFSKEIIFHQWRNCEK